MEFWCCSYDPYGKARSPGMDHFVLTVISNEHHTCQGWGGYIQSWGTHRMRWVWKCPEQGKRHLIKRVAESQSPSLSTHVFPTSHLSKWRTLEVPYLILTSSQFVGVLQINARHSCWCIPIILMNKLVLGGKYSLQMSPVMICSKQDNSKEILKFSDAKLPWWHTIICNALIISPTFPYHFFF